jgi:hypothetical protein
MARTTGGLGSGGLPSFIRDDPMQFAVEVENRLFGERIGEGAQEGA